MASPLPFQAGSGPALDELAQPGARALRVDAQRNRALILRAAEEEFRRHGVDASIDDIAGRAGVGVGTVYRNYPTKEALLLAIVSARIEPMVQAARDACTAGDAGIAFFAFLRRLSDESTAFKALAETMVEAGVDLKAAKRDAICDLLEAVGELLVRAQRAGAVRPDVTIDDVTTLMAGLGHAASSAPDQSQRSRCVALVCDALRSDAHSPLKGDADH